MGIAVKDRVAVHAHVLASAEGAEPTIIKDRSKAVSIVWNLKRYGPIGSMQWLIRAGLYHGWLHLTPQGRREAIFDQLNRCDTDGYLSTQELRLPADSIHYAPIRPRRFASVLRKLKVEPRAFTFIDIGCGKGRPLLLAHAMGFRRLIGVELSESLALIASRNVAHLRNVQICSENAAEFQLPAEDLVVFLYNPFWNPTMDNFVANLVGSLTQHPRRLYVVYVNPFCEESFTKYPCFKVVARIPNYYVIYENALEQSSLAA